jgi:hypothetical protein
MKCVEVVFMIVNIDKNTNTYLGEALLLGRGVLRHALWYVCSVV